MYKTDIELEQDVKDKLAFEPSIDDSKIHVSIKNNIVTLFGMVSSLFEKTIAERTIRSVTGVKGVANELQVDLDAKFEYSLTRTVSFSAVNTITISPNPTTDKVFITSGDNATLQFVSLYSLEGRLMQTLNNFKLGIAL